jgi:hypothetical protein
MFGLRRLTSSQLRRAFTRMLAEVRDYPRELSRLMVMMFDAGEAAAISADRR